MNIFALSGFVNGIAAIIFGSFVYFKNCKKLSNKTFGLMTFSFAIWSLGYGFWQISGQKEIALFWVRILSVGSIFIPITFLHWVFSILDIKKKKAILIIGYLFSIILLLFSFSPLYIKDVSPQLFFDWWPEPGILYNIYLIFGYFGIVGYACYELLKNYNKLVGYKHEQIKYILLAVLVGFGGGATNFPLWYKIPVIPYGNFIVCLYPLILSYAISYYRLMDISLIIGRGIIYIFSFSSVIGINFYLFFLNNKLAQPISLNIFGPLVIALSILLFQLFFNLYEKLASKYFYYTFYSYQKVLTDLGEKITKILDLNRLTSLIVDTLIKTMKLNRAVILMREQDGHYAILKNIGFKQENGISLVTDNFLTRYLQKRKKPLVYEELSLIQKDCVLKEDKRRLEKLKDNMNKIEADICLPLFRENKIVGIIVLGKKISGDAYSKEDIDLLVALSNQASIALENARLYERVEDLSENLQEKVNQQTKELKQAYNKIEHAYEVEKKAHQELKDLGEAKNQFILATQHHLRTPLTIMKGYASMLIEGDYGKLNKKAKEKLVFFSGSTQKLINLVNEFLDISQFKVGKKILKIEKIDIQKLVKEVIKEFKVEAEKKGIYLKFKKLNRISMIKADYAKLREAIYNIINNGIKYTEKGGITIFLEMKSKKLKIIIQDTGIGMNKKEINSLFEKTFERSKGAQKLYTLGRGIGLYISSSIIKAHNGKIWAESLGENSGSTFYIELPVR